MYIVTRHYGTISPDTYRYYKPGDAMNEAGKMVVDRLVHFLGTHPNSDVWTSAADISEANLAMVNLISKKECIIFGHTITVTEE